ncbi:MAG: hypothetical protein SGCHY_002401 [Lobulomycetales sp.]
MSSMHLSDIVSRQVPYQYPTIVTPSELGNLGEAAAVTSAPPGLELARHARHLESGTESPDARTSQVRDDLELIVDSPLRS